MSGSNGTPEPGHKALHDLLERPEDVVGAPYFTELSAGALGPTGQGVPEVGQERTFEVTEPAPWWVRLFSLGRVRDRVVFRWSSKVVGVQETPSGGARLTWIVTRVE